MEDLSLGSSGLVKYAKDCRLLVLLGHGGSGAKDAAGNLEHRDYLTGQLGISTAAIDGPVHGERGGVRPQTIRRYTQMWHAPNVIDHMNTDWTCTLDALLDLDEFDQQTIGYLGL